ncbi:hypothetical protein ACFPT7_09715 [Acidicapsa dinghuensis]|uniref:NHL repeat containing protein n=1 Tax=Acidicapsa dinghuensis TaxID=2218256 RepID=A0ABW1EE65_9BACT|nr:hypothetical protein [Acidicapsa dinghuensis]
MRKLSPRISLLAFSLVLFAVALPALSAPDPQPQSGPFATPVTDASLDMPHFAEWVDGHERPLQNPNALRQLVWTRATMPSSSGMAYGASAEPGPRYLRLAFTQPVAIGSVLVRSGGQLSVLRPGAPYPGNLADDSQWLPAQRISQGQLADGEVSTDGYTVWVLPSVTQTRAIRFSHVASASDTTYTGSMDGIYVLSTRFANLATLGNVQVSANNAASGKLINDKFDWHPWDNGPDFRHTVSALQPEWIILHWQHPVTLRGLATLWAGFNAADVEVFTGPAGVALEGAPESDWRVVGHYTLSNQYPLQLGVDWFDFGSDITTRAVRLRMTEVTNESHHPHLKGSTHDGTRVWLAGLMALSPLGGNALPAMIASSAPPAIHPPIPVQFTLPAAGYVSLVIDDAAGNRVRNLVSDTYFPAGSNNVWWDGSSDTGRDRDAASHGEYYIPTNLVAPGQYTVRGIEHQAVNLSYEFSVYEPGNPPWDTADGTGGWLTTHTPAWSTLFVPADKAPGGKPLVYLGCYVAEGGAGFAWVDLNGNKQGGKEWIGGGWTGAAFLARDRGPHADARFYAYAAAVFGDRASAAKTQSAVLRLTGLTAQGDKPLLAYNFNMGQPVPGQPSGSDRWPDEAGGLAAWNGVLAVSFPLLNQVFFVEAASGNVLGQSQVQNPRGLTFDSQGNLLVLAGKQILRFSMPLKANSPTLAQPHVVVADGLDDPHGITVDDQNNIYVSDWGNSNQVKVFSSAGKLLLVIGHAGPAKVGPYDSLHMNHPLGLTIDSNQHLWVAEQNFQPKRVSIWTLDGQFVKAFYGGPEYGGGGSLDAADKTKFYYDGMEFKLDWDKGTSSISDILYLRDQSQSGPIPFPAHSDPSTPIEGHGHQYFHNTFLGHGTEGVPIAVLYGIKNGASYPIAAAGTANDWPLLQSDSFRSLWPAGTNPLSNKPQDAVFFTWSDVNGNGKVDPAEVSMEKGLSGSLTLMPDLSIVDAYLDGKAVRLVPARFTSEGVPIYDLHSIQTLAAGAQLPLGDGGGQALYSPQGVILTTAPEPFSRDAIGGIDAQNHRWSYPNLWPGLHPSHDAPVPDHPGELIGVTRLLGEPIHPGPGTETLWGVNSNEGDLYIFTMDGFFVTQLFQDVRTGQPWTMPRAIRNMSLNQVSLHDEDFFPSITQTSDGKVYVDDGYRTALVRVDGLNTVHRLPNLSLQITSQHLMQAQAFFKQREAARQQEQGAKALDVAMRSGPAPQLSEVPELMKNASWATIDHRTNTLGFGHLANDAETSIMIAGGNLYAVFRTGDANLLRNSAAVVNAPFKSGGALDLMIGNNPGADPKRTAAVAGDERLLVYQVNKQTKAMLYRPVSLDAKSPVSFSSPLRTITMDSVQDVSSQVQLLALSGNDAGTYVLSVPLQELGLKPAPGETIRADIGLLRGDGTQTLQRVYWSNKATAIVSDVPSEAELTPGLWGTWTFKTAP